MIWSRRNLIPACRNLLPLSQERESLPVCFLRRFAYSAHEASSAPHFLRRMPQDGSRCLASFPFRYHHENKQHQCNRTLHHTNSQFLVTWYAFCKIKLGAFTDTVYFTWHEGGLICLHLCFSYNSCHTQKRKNIQILLKFVDNSILQRDKGLHFTAAMQPKSQLHNYYQIFR